MIWKYEKRPDHQHYSVKNDKKGIFSGSVGSQMLPSHLRQDQKVEGNVRTNFVNGVKNFTLLHMPENQMLTPYESPLLTYLSKPAEAMRPCDNVRQYVDPKSPLTPNQSHFQLHMPESSGYVSSMAHLSPFGSEFSSEQKSHVYK